MEETKKSKLNESLLNGKYDELVDIVVVNKTKYRSQVDAYKKVKEELKKREPFIDFETEVLPNLSSEWAYIFKNYMIEPNGAFQEEIGKAIGYTYSGVSKAIGYILNNIDLMIENKKKRDAFIQKYGEKENLKDFENCLNEREKDLLNDVILGIDPYSSKKFCHKYSNFNTTQNIKFLMNKLSTFISQKKECEKFIKDNGGEEFLINEFAPTLNDDYFEIFIKYMMDYHNLSNSIEDYAYYQFIRSSQVGIKKELEKYHARKKEVDALIESAGGAEKVLNEIYLPLDDENRKIFEERILAYKQTTQDELGKEFGVTASIIHRREQRLMAKLEGLVKANAKKTN